MDTYRQADAPHTGAGGYIPGHTLHDLLLRQVQILADGGGHGGGVDHVVSRGGDGQPVAAAGGGDGAVQAVDAPADDIRDPDIAAFALAAAECFKGQGQAVEQGVVAAQNGQPTGPQMVEYLALGLENALPRTAQVLDVGVAYVGDHGDGGLHQAAHIADLAEVVQARFDNRCLVSGLQLQQRLGGANVIIEICPGFQGAEVSGQHRGEHLLGGGFSGGAGDLYHGDVIQPPVPGGQRTQSQCGVLDLNIELAGQQCLRHTAAQAACRAVGKRCVHVIMTVEPRTHQGDEQVAGGDAAAVAGDAGDGVASGLEKGPAYGAADVRRRQGPHARPPLRRARDSSTMRWHRSP